MSHRKEYLRNYYKRTVGRVRDGKCAICQEQITPNIRNHRLYCTNHTEKELNTFRQAKYKENRKRKEFTTQLFKRYGNNENRDPNDLSPSRDQ